MASRPFVPDKAIRELHRRYLAGEAIAALTREVGYKPGSLAAAFRRLGLKSLGRTNSVQTTDPRVAEAIALWDSGLTAKAAGERVGLSQTIMSRLLRESGRDGRRSGPAHSHWKGGRGKNVNGYIHVWLSPDDPMSSMRRTGGHVFEHRLVMARHLGRPLRSHETVHHINGVRDDNRLENLELRTGQHGPGAAWRCADCGSANIVSSELHAERNENDV